MAFYRRRVYGRRGSYGYRPRRPSFGFRRRSRAYLPPRRRYVTRRVRFGGRRW